MLAAMRDPDRDMAAVREAAGVPPDKHLIPIRLDLDDQRSVETAVDEVLDRVGAPDGVVHNAGVAGVGSIEEMPLDAWQHIFSTNLF